MNGNGNGYDLAPGARNAIRTCLKVMPQEHVVIVTDRETEPVAESLAAEIREVGAPFELFVLEDYGNRPMFELPQAVRDTFERSEVSIYAGQPKPGELAYRREMTAIVNRRRMRHAHMVSVSPRIMAEGMRADFEEVDAISTRVRDRAAKAERIRARSRAGSDLEATFDPSVRWLKTSGLITPDKWANLPGGEVLTAPARVDGVYVVDGVLGDYLCARYGDLEATPLTIWIENSRVAEAQCERPEIREDFLAYTRTEENSDRVGEFAMGTNVAVHSIIGNILQDEKLPGLHLAFGHTYAEHTGASWTCRTHLDIVGRHFDVWFDDEQVMADGKFLI
ncbi:MAG TPA: aminopeptidase [Thermoanaerobaculia bacterium]|nr:aminopeptidase [Thermoanaerobaculia bacterium]